MQLLPKLAQHHRPRQSRQQLGEVKAAVEAVGGLGQIVPRILGLAHGVVAAADRPFDVAEHHVHPAPQVPQLIAQLFDWPTGEQAKMTQQPGIRVAARSAHRTGRVAPGVALLTRSTSSTRAAVAA